MDLNRLVSFALDLNDGVAMRDAAAKAGIHHRQAFHWLNRLEEWGVELKSIAGMPGQYRVTDWGPINIHYYRESA